MEQWLLTFPVLTSKKKLGRLVVLDTPFLGYDSITFFVEIYTFYFTEKANPARYVLI